MGLSFSNHLTIHLFSIIASPALKVTRGAGANLIYPQAKVGLHPSRNFITGPHREITIGTRTRTHSCSQSRAQFLDGGKKLENLRRTHTDPGSTCKLHSKRPQARAHPRNLTDYSLVDNQSSKPKRSSLGSYVADKKKHSHSSTQFRGLCFIHTSRASMSHSHPHWHFYFRKGICVNYSWV